jgi:hypothetical protein
VKPFKPALAGLFSKKHPKPGLAPRMAEKTIPRQRVSTQSELSIQVIPRISALLPWDEDVEVPLVRPQVGQHHRVPTVRGPPDPLDDVFFLLNLGRLCPVRLRAIAVFGDYKLGCT